MTRLRRFLRIRGSAHHSSLITYYLLLITYHPTPNTLSPYPPYIHFPFACHAARISFSRAAVMPERRLACRWAGCFLNHSRVAAAVSLTGRNVIPFATALLLLRLLKPPSGPFGATHTGMSYHG